ncbi:hypothetical protein B0H16DRAFT_1478017 [Mycena metata]|uniref:Uncharacterized protein n=1 Tax=Mycena metata TaxID=1033252 RepID=A0AAD7H8X8_9AGAR|nr:hypothetical protein B0H16DRAFT_1478017 [Mycena metata]
MPRNGKGVTKYVDAASVPSSVTGFGFRTDPEPEPNPNRTPIEIRGSGNVGFFPNLFAHVRTCSEPELDPYEPNLGSGPVRFGGSDFLAKNRTEPDIGNTSAITCRGKNCAMHLAPGRRAVDRQKQLRLTCPLCDETLVLHRRNGSLEFGDYVPKYRPQSLSPGVRSVAGYDREHSVSDEALEDDIESMAYDEAEQFEMGDDPDAELDELEVE